MEREQVNINAEVMGWRWREKWGSKNNCRRSVVKSHKRINQMIQLCLSGIRHVILINEEVAIEQKYYVCMSNV